MIKYWKTSVYLLKSIIFDTIDNDLKTPGQPSDTDKTRWNEFRAGKSAAFDQLMQAHYRALFNYGTKFTKDTEFVKDCIQDLFLELWKNRQNLGETEYVRSYLLKSFRRKLFRQLYKNQWRTQVESLDEDYSFDIEFSAESRLVDAQNQQETSEKLTRLLNQLPRRQKEVIYLRFYQELDVEQIVQVMEINTQSVYNLLHKALHQMKQYWLDESIWCLLFFQLLP
jgi:RNA polymerase sigma factor (sigma-70 family)